MRNQLGLVAGLLVLGIGILSTDESGAANAVQKTADNCVSAHAVLMVSADGDHNRYWEAIARVIRSPVHWWRVVDEPTPMVAQTFSLRQYDLRFDEGTAYVAHCGAGFTCNKLAEEVLKSFPDSGSPKVYCGPIPHVLDNPQSPTVSIETPADATPVPAGGTAP